MSLNQRVTAEFSTCTPSAPPTAHLSIQTILVNTEENFLLAAPGAHWPFSSTEAQYRSFINRGSPCCTGYVTALLVQHLLRFL